MHTFLNANLAANASSDAVVYAPAGFLNILARRADRLRQTNLNGDSSASTCIPGPFEYARSLQLPFLCIQEIF